MTDPDPERMSREELYIAMIYSQRDLRPLSEEEEKKLTEWKANNPDWEYKEPVPVVRKRVSLEELRAAFISLGDISKPEEKEGIDTADEQGVD